MTEYLHFTVAGLKNSALENLKLSEFFREHCCSHLIYLYHPYLEKQLFRPNNRLNIVENGKVTVVPSKKLSCYFQPL